MSKWSLFTLFFLVGQWSNAAYTFEFSDNCVQAYHSALSLKAARAQSLINTEKLAHPNNLVPVFLENYLDFLELFLNEDPKKFQELKENKKKRIALISAGPASSPLRDYMVAVIHLQWAVVDIKFGNRFNSGLGFRDALKTIKDNQKKFPNFTPNLMIAGPMQMAASSIPKGYKWLSSLIGISGDLALGKAQMERFLSANDPWAKFFREEGIFYNCYMQFYLLNEPDEALKLIKTGNLDLVNKQLFTFMASNLYLNDKQSKQALLVVQNRNKSPEYMTTNVWDFVLAYANLFHLEPSAEEYFKKYLQNFKGSYYVKDAWHKLSFHYLIQGKMKEYQWALNKVKTVGKQETEADKRAYREAVSGVIPNVDLLKARMLSDGGYHREALAALAGKSSADFKKPSERLEFTYRLGRIYDDLGQNEKAIQTYEITYKNGQKATEYYASRAALQIGLIHENASRFEKAIEYYNKCIELEGHDFENSLEQKAKAGIERCKLKLKST